MGLLDSVIGQVVGQVLGGGRGETGRDGNGPGDRRGDDHGDHRGGVADALSSPIVQALIMLVLSKAGGSLGGGLGGALGDILGGGRGPHPGGPARPGSEDASDGSRPDAGDLGGFGRPAPSGGDDFSDLSGMLDGPGEPDPRGPGRGPYAELDRNAGDDAGAGAGGGDGAAGLGGLIAGFERSGLGEVIGSWIGHGGNRPIAPNRLADALGSDTIDALSRRTGMGREELLGQLAQALPAVIDRLTPQGRPPSRDETRDWL